VAQHAESTWLHVERGRVVVAAADSRRALEAGEEAWFPAGSALGARERAHLDSAKAAPTDRKLTARASSRASAAAAVPSSLARAAARFDARAPDRAPDQVDTTWREHAERGDFKGAFPLLPARDTVAAMNVSELLLAADAARLSGHPDAALPYLRRVVEEHAEDARAPLAAFTLGGVLMHQLGMPREAEAAYARARATSLSGALAQDALARQVEAAHRAGDEALARNLARDYLERYPQGRRVHAVRRFGGL
jgi:transmembrane sensor